MAHVVARGEHVLPRGATLLRNPALIAIGDAGAGRTRNRHAAAGVLEA